MDARDGLVRFAARTENRLRRAVRVGPIGRALADRAARFEDVTRTRILLTDIANWEHAARAHGEVFGAIRPACTVVEVSRFVDPDWLVELEADAIVQR